jgi:hypothetical protein
VVPTILTNLAGQIPAGSLPRQWAQGAAIAALAAALLLLPVQPAAARGPDGIADVAEQVIDAVVNISTSQKIDPRAEELPDLPPGSPMEKFFDQFFKNHRGQGGQGGDNSDDTPRRINSLGSGFIIDPSGLVVTNNHVIADADEISVILNDGTKLKADLVGKDTKADLALLRVHADKPLKSVKFGDSDKLRRKFGAVVEDDVDLVGVGDDVIVGDDEAGRVDDEARTEGGDAVRHLTLVAARSTWSAWTTLAAAAVLEELFEKLLHRRAGRQIRHVAEPGFDFLRRRDVHDRVDDLLRHIGDVFRAARRSAPGGKGHCHCAERSDQSPTLKKTRDRVDQSRARHGGVFAPEGANGAQLYQKVASPACRRKAAEVVCAAIS